MERNITNENEASDNIELDIFNEDEFNQEVNYYAQNDIATELENCRCALFWGLVAGLPTAIATAEVDSAIIAAAAGAGVVEGISRNIMENSHANTNNVARASHAVTSGAVRGGSYAALVSAAVAKITEAIRG